MTTEIINRALLIANRYLIHNFSNYELKCIAKEIFEITGIELTFDSSSKPSQSYEDTQDLLETLNEKESIRRNKGVYYTPSDVVRFILVNSVKFSFNKLKSNNLRVLDLNGIPYRNFCYEKSIYDPTCGSGAFLLSALVLKLDMLDLHHSDVTKGQVQKVVATIKGNDVNAESIMISKLRLLLCVLHRYGVAKISGLASVLNGNFECFDYVNTAPARDKAYDIIIGNPPYVEDAKCEVSPSKKYGNIYANVLENATLQLTPGGVIGFIIPLSYVSTPRMQKIREELYKNIPEQYILSFSDRPDCLFTAVHQKLCILFGRNSGEKKSITTGNYRYWYKEERQDLFDRVDVVKNGFVEDEFIPKLGTSLDVSVYKKIATFKKPIIALLESKKTPLYLNMRAAFWIKAFLNKHQGAEYKEFFCENDEIASYCMCLLNSSLFWWYWICVSDCWHITRKELVGFKVPEKFDFGKVSELASALEKCLEETKLYVGTKQTEYEYKHKDCALQIHEIDDFINEMYGLTEEESLYIKNFAYRYRIGGGVGNECN